MTPPTIAATTAAAAAAATPRAPGQPPARSSDHQPTPRPTLQPTPRPTRQPPLQSAHPAADLLAPVPGLAMVALSLAALASGASIRVTDPLLPRLAQAFSITLGQAAQAITVYAVAYGLAQLLFGPLGDRYGKYRVIAWACAASALSTAACALAQSHGALLLARLASGATAAAVIPLAMAWIGDVVPYAQRQPVLARFLIGQITGFALGVWAGGYAGEHLNWQAPFWGIAAVFAVAAALMQLMRRRLPARAVLAQAPAGHPLRRMQREFAAVLAVPWARRVLVTVFLEGVAIFGPLAFVAAHLHQRFGLPLSQAGAMLMLFAGGSLAFALNAHWLVPRLGEARLVRTGATLMAGGLLGLAVAPSWGWAVPACAALGLGYYMMHNTLQTHATQMAPERRGAAVASFAACLFLGQSLGVALAGWGVDRAGAGWVLAAGALGLLALGWRFPKK